MPYTQDGLPFSGRSPVARHNSYKAAIAAAPRRQRLQDRYLDLLREHEMVTDAGAAELLHCPLSSICSTRGALMDRGLVEAAGSTMGRFNTMVTIWRLK